MRRAASPAVRSNAVEVPCSAIGRGYGGGEPAIINMGAVVANAIFDATGARLHRLPMTPERVLAEIRRG